MSLTNKSILLTGASGFIGSNLTFALIKKKAKVVVLARNPQSKSPLVFSKVKKWEVATVENYSKVERIVKENKIDIIFHLAAQTLVEKGAESPHNTLRINVEGTWNVLEAARRNNVNKVIIASTAQIYGDNPNIPYKEKYYPRPTRPYETSKACAELLARSYASTYDLDVYTPRFVNVYGPGDLNFNRLVPKIIKTVINGDKPTVWNKKVVRDFLYIDDAVRAYLLLAQSRLPKKDGAFVYNFGAGKAHSIYDIAEKIVRISDNDSLRVEAGVMPAGRRGEILKQYVSVAKAKKELGWKPKVTLNNGLKRTYAWYKKYFKNLANV